MNTRNYSKKREAILNALKKTDTHPTAEELYNSIKKDFPDISIATVYRNLNLFCETGEAVSVGVINGYERFDANIDHHGHFLCKNCGLVKDIEVSFNTDSLYKQIISEYNIEIDSHDLIFHGKCNHCI